MSSVEIIKGKRRRSGSCVEDLQNPVSRWIDQRSEEVTVTLED
jgi:hypothetical protein